MSYATRVTAARVAGTKVAGTKVAATKVAATQPATSTAPALAEAKPLGGETLSRIRLHGLLDQLLEEGLAVELRVTGSSMSPFLRGGDLVTLVPVPGRVLAPGDIIAFLAQSRWLVIHRIVGVGADTILTRGDSLWCNDPPVSRDDVLAVVSAVERGRRRRRLGLGAERTAIAWLSGHGWLVPLLFPLRALVRGLRGWSTSS